MEIVTIPMTPFVTNCFVVKDGDEALVIDPGEVTPELIGAIGGCKVRTIVNTHAHCDHCSGNAELIRRTGAPLAMNEADLLLLRNLPQQGIMFGTFSPASPDPDIYLREGDTVTVGAVSMEVRHVPGHSPGHVALVCDGVVFCGDVLFAGSIGRTDLPGSSHEQLMKSIQTKLMVLPDETTVYPGHGPATTIGAERANNPYLRGL